MLSFWRTGNLERVISIGETAADQVLKDSSMPSDIAVSFLWSCGLCAAATERDRDAGIRLVERAAEEVAKQAEALDGPEKTRYDLWREAALRHKERLEGGESWGPATVFEGKPEASVRSALLISNNHDAPIALKVGAAIHQQYGAEVCHTPRLEDACRASGVCVVFGSALAPELGGDFCALLEARDARRIREIAARIHTDDREIPEMCASVTVPEEWPAVEKVFSVAGGTYTGTILAGRRFADMVCAEPDMSRWALV